MAKCIELGSLLFFHPRWSTYHIFVLCSHHCLYQFQFWFQVDTQIYESLFTNRAFILIHHVSKLSLSNVSILNVPYDAISKQRIGLFTIYAFFFSFHLLNFSETIICWAKWQSYKSYYTVEYIKRHNPLMTQTWTHSNYNQHKNFNTKVLHTWPTNHVL